MPEKKAKTVVAGDPADLKGKLKEIGGSRSDDWNNVLANQAINSLSLSSDESTRHRQLKAAVSAMAGIAPKDELERMMVAQLIAAHSAAIGCPAKSLDIRSA